MHACMCMRACGTAHIRRAKDFLWKSVLPFCAFQGWEFGVAVWWQAHFPTKPFHQSVQRDFPQGWDVDASCEMLHREQSGLENTTGTCKTEICMK